MEKLSVNDQIMKKKSENFWYHYKWHVIVTAFLLLVVGMIVTSLLEKDEPDTLIYYGGPAYFSEDAVGSVERAFEQLMALDFNGDGKKIAQLITTTVLSGDQIATKVMDAREEGELLFMGDLTASDSEYRQEILYGQGIICLLDYAHFEESKERFQRFDKLFDKNDLPEGMFEDGKGIFLKDTAFGKYFEVFDGLPDDTVLCIKIQPIHIEDDKYENAKNILRAALEFDLVRPEPEVEEGK